MKRAIVIALLFWSLVLFPTTSRASLSATPVQSAGGSTGAAAASFTVTMGSTPTAGNVLIAAIDMGSTQSIKVTETGVSWRQLSPQINNAVNASLTLWIGPVASGAGTTITITSNSGNQKGTAYIAEFSGNNVVFDNVVLATATGNSTSPAVTIPSQEVANSLRFAALGAQTAVQSGQATIFSSPTNSFSIVGQQNTTANTTNDFAVALLVRLDSSTGSISAGATISSNQWCASGASVKEVTSAGTTISTFVK
jgi:hypothetical protein